MNDKSWCQNLLKTKEAQTQLEEKVSMLVDSYFKGKSEYAIEKFVKSFSETFVYLENSLLKDRKLHSSQMEENMEFFMANPQEVIKRTNEVKSTLENEINRQYRHYQTFLSEIVS